MTLEEMMPTVPCALCVSGLGVHTGEGAIRDLDFELGVGEAAAITSIGPADLRKLLEILAGLERPDAGKVSWNRIPALSLLEKEGTSTHRRYRILRGLRQTTGYISGSTSLLHTLTIFENIALPLRYHFDPPEDVVDERVARLLALLGLEESRDLRPAGLPIGILRRAALARALILEPTVLFLESPFSDIDNESAGVLMAALSHFRDKAGLAVLTASYEPRTLLPLVSRVLVLQEGRLVRILQGGELDVQEFFEHMGQLQAKVRREDRVSCARP